MKTQYIHITVVDFNSSLINNIAALASKVAGISFAVENSPDGSCSRDVILDQRKNPIWEGKWTQKWEFVADPWSDGTFLV